MFSCTIVADYFFELTLYRYLSLLTELNNDPYLDLSLSSLLPPVSFLPSLSFLQSLLGSLCALDLNQYPAVTRRRGCVYSCRASGDTAALNINWAMSWTVWHQKCNIVDGCYSGATLWDYIFKSHKISFPPFLTALFKFILGAVHIHSFKYCCVITS